jgi:hypothetical protein
MDRITAIKTLRKDPIKFFSKQCKLVSKVGEESFFKLNETQQIIHDKAAEQLKRDGKVRIVILKGRQQGCTTYIRMRFLHKVMYNKGLKARIMVHLHDAGKDLFSLVRQCYDGVHEQLRPLDTKNNESILEFEHIKSRISIATAGSKGSGRSATLQLFHGSEVAFWDNAQDHTRGMMQALSSGDGSECFLESTANGMTGDAEEFYNKFMGGLDGDGDFESLFIPWFTNSEYQSALPNDFELITHSSWCEREYKEKYNLTDNQVLWARKKINTDFNKRYDMFCIEYPATPEEAFEGTGELSFIENKVVIEARRREFQGKGEITIGVDVGGDEHAKDPDRTVIAMRQGKDFKILFEKKGISRSDLLNKLAEVILEINPQRIRIDVTGIGHNIDVDLITLCNMRSIPIADCQGVNFGSNAIDSVQFVNIRAEMYYYLRENLIVGSCDDSADLQKDLTALGYKRDKTRRLQMEPKKNLSSSPDLADAMALCCHKSQAFFSGVIA